MHGAAPGDATVDPARFAAAVAELDADVLALQEVDRDQPRSGGADLAAWAAEAMGATHWHFAPTVAGTPGLSGWRAAGGDVPAGRPAYGIALLSRRPLQPETIHFGAAPLFLPVFTGRGVVVAREEPRAAVVGVVEGDRGPVTVAATHLAFVPGWNVLQLRRLARHVTREGSAAVVLGDLNLGAGIAARVSGLTPLVQGATFPVGRPRWQPDHVLVRGHRGVSAPHVRRLPVSDHRAVVVDVDL